MNAAVITDSIDDGSAGVGSYARGLAAGLRQIADRGDLTFVHRRPHSFYDGMQQLIVPDRGGKLVRKQLIMPRVLAGAGFDVVHDTFHFPPFLGPTPFARVMTIHDMTPFVLDRRNMQFRHWLRHRALMPRLARRAHHILADSQHTRSDVIRVLKIPEGRVSVAHLAADDSFCPQPAARVEQARRRYGLPERYLLYVGTIEPRKNLVRLVRAFESAAPHLGDTSLVLAGGLGWQQDDIVKAVRTSPLRERILMPGRIDDEHLAGLYAGALASVYVSLYEGFGLPPLEAMQSGCPVIASRTTSIPEVVGDAALTVDPTNEAAIAEAITRIATQPTLRADLVQRGLKRATAFSWRRCAESTLLGYQAALSLSSAAFAVPGGRAARRGEGRS